MLTSAKLPTHQSIAKKVGVRDPGPVELDKIVILLSNEKVQNIDLSQIRINLALALLAYNLLHNKFVDY